MHVDRAMPLAPATSVWWLAGCLCAVALHALPARADWIERVRVTGNARTRAAVVESMLPCRLPCEISEVARAEIERRLYNLAIFDAVSVRLADDELQVVVREKWTLIPYAMFSTGESAADIFVAVGLTEYNFLGSATLVEAGASWEQRGPNGFLFWSDHDYDVRRGGFLGWVDYTSSSFRFADGQEWIRDAAGLGIGWKLPAPHRSPLRWTVAMAFEHERLARTADAPAHPNGVTVSPTLGVVFDRYAFRDLAPRGFKLAISATVGAFVPAAQARHEATLDGLGSLAISETTALLLRLRAGVVTSGNPNHSLLLGSQGEVRGVEDAFYRSRAQAVANAEFRQAVRLAARWAVQGALFTDAAWFEPFDASGVSGRPIRALSLGGGVRVVPTWISGVVLRIDVARLLAPRLDWFWQLALNQYF